MDILLFCRGSIRNWLTKRTPHGSPNEKLSAWRAKSVVNLQTTNDGRNLHWSNSKTLSFACPIKSLKNSSRRGNRHGTDRLKPTPKPGSLINWPNKRCAIIARGSASGFRETRFDSQPEIFRPVPTSAARHKSESAGKLSTIARIRPFAENCKTPMMRSCRASA